MKHRINRREALAGAASIYALTLAPLQSLRAAGADGPVAKARNFLGALGPDEAGSARFEFGGATHRAWNFMGTGVKPGLLVERMSAEQKDAADALLRQVLSSAGYNKMRLVMATQDVMRELGQGPRSRNSERFSLSVFGEPAAERIWGLRIEGHHLSLNWTLKGEEIVSVTPSSFSVIPQSIPIGARKGTIVLEAEEFLARRLIGDLSGTQKDRAVISERAAGNVRALSGWEDRFKEKQGVAAAELTSAQRDLLWELIETTAVAPWPQPFADAQRQRVRSGDQAAVHFAWEGGLKRGEMFYYRVHGDSFTLELASVFGDPEHLHASFQDPERTFGKHIV